MTTINKFQQFLDIGMMDQLLPIIPATGVISAGSTLKQSDAGKQPGIYNPATNEWTGFPGWSIHKTTFEDIQLWSTWPGDLVGVLTRLHPTVDVDIEKPELVHKVTNVLTMFANGTGLRVRDNSYKISYYLELASGENVQGKRKIILKDNLGAIELLWGGQQSVLCGTHPSGGKQTFTGKPIVVTAAQLEIIWDQLIAVMGDLVQEVTKAGEYTLNNTGNNIDYVDTKPETIEQVKQYIDGIPGIDEGGRDDQAYKMVAHIREYFGIPAEIVSQLMPSWGERCDPPFPMSEIQPRINSVYSGSAQSAQGSGNVNGVFQKPDPLPPHISPVPLAPPPKPKEAKNKPEIIPCSPTGIYTYSEKVGTAHWDPHQINTRLIPDSTFDNFEIMLNCYQITIIYDVVAKNVIINGPGINYESDISENACLGQIVALCKLNRIDTGIIMDYISILMSKNEQNPVEKWIHSKSWDGVDRIDELFNTLTLAPEQDRNIAYMMFRKWLIGAAKIVQRKIGHFESVLVLQDSLGGTGKTAWFKSLCPEPWRKDGVRLNPEDKDSIKQSIGYWLVELGELDSIFRKSDIKHLMAFLSNSHDEIRLPYAKSYNRYARRTAFFATVNKREFLIDDSGDRRFWPIAILAINYDHGIDMQQLWAQVDTLNEPHWLDDKENILITDTNKEFKTVDPIDERLEIYFGGPTMDTPVVDQAGNQLFDPVGKPMMQPADNIHLNCTEILNNSGIHFPNKAQLNKAGTWLRDRFTRVKRNGKTGYIVPVMVSTPG